MEQFSKEGRKLRPRKSAAASAARTEKVDYAPRREGGEHRTYGSRQGSERPGYGDRKPYGARPSGERKSYGDKPAFGERKSYGARPSGDRKPFGERKTYGDKPAFGERKSYGDKPAFGERKSYGSRPSGDRKPFGERKSYGDKPAFGERKSYGDKPAFGERKSFGSKPGFAKKPFGKKPFAKKDDYQFSHASDEGIDRMISRRPRVDDESRYSDFDAATTPIKDEIRLNKFIANSGVCSRREADTLIQAGVVTVNGEVVTELGTKINVFTDDIRFNGERLKGEEKVYIVMNKPRGYVTTSSDPHAEKTVMELLKGCESRVFPVGRLDKNTTGVLMFTNDGEIAERLTHPSYDKKKIYQVILDKELSKEDYDKILAGIELTDGPVAADELEYIDAEDRRKIGIEIHSGKNRIVRRIFESLGYDVRNLDRVYFAGLTKKGLKKGEWRFLSEGETNILKMGAYL